MGTDELWCVQLAPLCCTSSAVGNNPWNWHMNSFAREILNSRWINQSSTNVWRLSTWKTVFLLSCPSARKLTENPCECRISVRSNCRVQGQDKEDTVRNIDLNQTRTHEVAITNMLLACRLSVKTHRIACNGNFMALEYTLKILGSKIYTSTFISNRVWMVQLQTNCNQVYFLFCPPRISEYRQFQT